MLALLGELGWIVEGSGRAVHEHPREPPPLELCEELPKLPLAMDHERGQKDHGPAAGNPLDLVRNLLRGLRSHRFSAPYAALLAELGV